LIPSISHEASSACIQPKTDLAVTIVANPELSVGQTLHKTNTVIKVKVPLFTVCQHWLKLHVLHYITMAHHDRCIRECVIPLSERGRLPASTAGELYGVPMSTAREWLRKYWRDHLVGRRKGTGLWRVSSPAQDTALVAEAERNPFFSARDLKAATGFPGQKDTVISRLRAEVSGHGMLR